MSAQGDAATTLTPYFESKPRSRLSLSWRTFFTLAPAILIFGTFVVAGAFAPFLAPHDPGRISLLDRLEPPAWLSGGSWEHPFGTDHLGRDLLSRLIYGTRVSLIVVATTVPLSAGIGTFVGILAGWRRGFFDTALMRLVDLQLALPAILFAILIASVFGASLRNVIIVIVMFGWAGYARLARAEVLSLREREFVIAAKAFGASDVRIALRHLLPNLLDTIVILATLEVAGVILIEAALSFLAVGVAPGTASWGAMVSEGRNYMTLAWWVIWIPGLAIVLISLTGNLMGDWLRDVLDPRLRNVR